MLGHISCEIMNTYSYIKSAYFLQLLHLRLNITRAKVFGSTVFTLTKISELLQEIYRIFLPFVEKTVLKMYSEETIPSFHECSPLLGFIMSKNLRGL